MRLRSTAYLLFNKREYPIDFDFRVSLFSDLLQELFDNVELFRVLVVDKIKVPDKRLEDLRVELSSRAFDSALAKVEEKVFLRAEAVCAVDVIDPLVLFVERVRKEVQTDLAHSVPGRLVTGVVADGVGAELEFAHRHLDEHVHVGAESFSEGV